MWISFRAWSDRRSSIYRDYSHNSFFNSSKHFLQIPVSNLLLTRNFFTSVLTLSQKTHFFMFLTSIESHRKNGASLVQSIIENYIRFCAQSNSIWFVKILN